MPDHRNSSGSLMWAEIQEQPNSLLRVVESGLSYPGRNDSTDPFSPHFLAGVEQVVVFGNGSSFHAARLARDYLLRVARVPAQAVYASDAFSLAEPRADRTLALALSHSGSSRDVRGAVRRARRQGIRTGAITNTDGSPLSREAEACWVTGAGPEKAIPSTKGFTALAAASLLFASHVASARGACEGMPAAARLVSRAAEVLRRWLAAPGEARLAAELVDHTRAVAFVGKGLLYPVACDGALKLLEVSYVPALAYPPEEFRHGPVAMVDEEFVLVALVAKTRDSSSSKVMEEVTRAGGQVVVVGEAPASSSGEVTIALPHVDPLVTPLVTMPPLQVFAHAVGARLGRSIDYPRGLRKVVGGG